MVVICQMVIKKTIRLISSLKDSIYQSTDVFEFYYNSTEAGDCSEHPSHLYLKF